MHVSIREYANGRRRFRNTMIAPTSYLEGGYELPDKKLVDEKTKRREQLAEFIENLSSSIDPPSPVSRQEKWKMARTNRYRKMSSTATKEIADKIVSNFNVSLHCLFNICLSSISIVKWWTLWNVFCMQDSLEQEATQESFVPHGREDILNTTIGKPEHPWRVRVAGTGVTISQYFGQASRGSSTSSPSITQAQLADIIIGITDRVRRRVEEKHQQREDAWQREFEAQHTCQIEMMKKELQASIKIEVSQIASHQSVPIESALIHVLGARVSTKGSCAEP